MDIIAKTIKGKEFIYSNKTSILCTSEKQAINLAEFLNTNEISNNAFKLKNNECWHAYIIDEYDSVPQFKIKTTKNKISVVNYEV